MTASVAELIDDPVRRREARACDVVEAFLARIESAADLHAFVTVTPDAARAEAAALDARREAGAARGPLAGWTIAVKDNIDVGGVRGTRGSAFFAERIAPADAECVRRLRAADAIVVGTANLHELAYGATTDNPHHGTCRNPWDRTRTPGGSSGGSGAAVGADLCLAALGTDTGGSIRVPAALCNVSGLRPTFGSVSTVGTFPAGPSLDTVGPLARSVEDVAALTDVLAGYDPADPWAVERATVPALPGLGDGVAGLRIGVAAGGVFDEIDPDVAANVRASADRLDALGAHVDEVSIEGSDEAVEHGAVLIRAEALANHRERLAREPERFGPDVRRRLELGREIGGDDLAAATAAIQRWRHRVARRLHALDLVVTATCPGTAPQIDGAEMIATTARLTRITLVFSLAHVPALSIPAGPGSDGLPTGLQIVAAPGRDDLTLRAGHALQQVTDWHRARPAG